jgi:hypothetical protein
VAFTWENGLLATPDWLATIRGSATIGRREPHVRLSLRHVTAVVGGGLCQMLNDLDHPYLPQLDVQLNDNIVAADSGALLIEERGVDDRATYIDYVSWNGERNFYTGFDVQEVWRIDDQNRSDGAQRISATDWETRWGAGREVLPNWGGVVWRRPTLGLAFHDRSPDDYGLEESPDNMARSGASDGRDAGMIPYLLPPMPMTQAAP